MGVRKDSIVVPNELYLLTGTDYYGNRRSTVTDDLNSIRHKEKIRYCKDITEEIIENKPKHYSFRGLVRGNPIQLAELCDYDNKLYKVKSEPIIKAIIDYGCDPGGGLKAQLVWKKINGYFGLYIA